MLHYVENNKLLNDNTLVLIDAGCEVEGYAADITRTSRSMAASTPRRRTFTKSSRRAGGRSLPPPRPPFHGSARRRRARADPGPGRPQLLAGDLDNLIEKGDYRRFYMHRTGHWLGLDA